MSDTFVDRDLLLEDLFHRWGQLRSGGKDLDAREFVRDPALLAALQAKIDLVRTMEAALGRMGPGKSSEPDSKQPPPDLPGYLVLEELARGAQGVVYRARHRQLNRESAVKVLLHPKYAGKKTLYRFRLEAEAIAAVNHPNVVEVFESAEHNGVPYIVTEYCPGGTLAAKLKREGLLPPRPAAALLAKIAGGVGAGHDQGIVHRDLKPGNVLFDAAGEPKVADFGLARRDAGDDFTAVGFALGTPQYMSPEHAKGETRFAGPAADVWSLGIILFECLTGVRPFQGRTHQEIYAKVIAGHVPPLHQIRPDVPRDLARIVEKCLNVDPGRRYESAVELEADLKRFLEGEPVTASVPGPADAAARRLRRRRAVRTALWALGTGLVVLLPAVYLLEKQKAAAERARAEVEELGARKDTLHESLRAAVRKADDERIARSAMESQRAALTAYSALVRAAARDLAAGKYADAAKTLAATDPALRGWEFGHLQRVTTAVPTVLRVVTGEKAEPQPIHAFALNPAGDRVATGGADGAVRVWDVATGASVAVFDAESKAPLRAVAYSPDGRRIAAASDDRTVRVWAGDGGPRPLYWFVAPRPAVTVLKFKEDGGELAASNGDKLFLRPNVVEGLVKTIELPPVWVDATPVGGPKRAVTRDGKRVLELLENGTLSLRDTGRLLGPAEPPTGTPTFGNRAVNTHDDRIRIVDTDSGALLFELDTPGGTTAALFGPAGELKAFAPAATMTWLGQN